MPTLTDIFIAPFKETEQNIFLRTSRILHRVSGVMILLVVLYYLQEATLQIFRFNAGPVLIATLVVFAVSLILNLISGLKYGIMAPRFVKAHRPYDEKSKDPGSFYFSMALYLIAVVGLIFLIRYELMSL